MAKRRHIPSVAELEQLLGYRAQSLESSVEKPDQFYSDLRPVPNQLHDRIRDEYFERERRGTLDRQHRPVERDLKAVHRITSVNRPGEPSFLLTRVRHAGYFVFAVELRYSFGLELPLLLTNEEAASLVRFAELRPFTKDHLQSGFMHLPQEIRDRIYEFTVSTGPSQQHCIANVGGPFFTACMGNASGFYFPMKSCFNILKVNRQIRQEALPFTHRFTNFHLANIDDLVKTLVGIGKIGRDNVSSLVFAWESYIELQGRWSAPPSADVQIQMLPALHVDRCVRLLKQCKRLKYLRIEFEPDLMRDIDFEAFTTNAGITELCTLQQMSNVEIYGLDGECLEHFVHARWLKEKLGDSQRKRID